MELFYGLAELGPVLWVNTEVFLEARLRKEASLVYRLGRVLLGEGGWWRHLQSCATCPLPWEEKVKGLELAERNLRRSQTQTLPSRS